MAIYRDTGVFCLSITGTEKFQYRPLLLYHHCYCDAFLYFIPFQIANKGTVYSKIMYVAIYTCHERTDRQTERQTDRQAARTSRLCGARSGSPQL